jgi:hypothetical protein
MKQDRFLYIILGVIGALVVVALVLFFVRRGMQKYGPEDSPNGVANNYVLALQMGDFQRAYSYLAEGSGKPTELTFQQEFASRQLDISSASIQIDPAVIVGDTASIPVTLLNNSGLFGETFPNVQNGTLVRQGGAWKINSLPNPYWGYDWYNNAAPQGIVAPAVPVVSPTPSAAPLASPTP